MATLKLLYVTFPDYKTAFEISDVLLKERLIACYNLSPMNSGYWWKGEITKDKEVSAILKTTDNHIPRIEERISELHPYDVPCIMNMDFEANKAYEKWIVESVAKDA